MKMGRPKLEKPPEDVYRTFNEEYAKAILKSPRRNFRTQVKDAVVDAMELLCSIITYGNIFGYKCYKNDLIETMVAWIVSDPEILDSYLKKVWGLSLFPENGSKPVLEVVIEPKEKIPNSSLIKSEVKIIKISEEGNNEVSTNEDGTSNQPKEANLQGGDFSKEVISPKEVIFND